MATGPQNERIGVEACLSNPGFRQLLLEDKTNRAALIQYFTTLGITFDNDNQRDRVLDQIALVDWSALQELEHRLKGSALDILTG
jgi:hypothetical protein